MSLTILYDVIKSDINNNTKLELIKNFDKVLSLNLLKEEKQELDENTLNKINELIEKRNIAKKEKNYEEADRIRNELLDMNIIIKDTREGTSFEIKK